MFGSISDVILPTSRVVTFSNLEYWENLRQALDELHKKENYKIYDWECRSEREFQNGEISQGAWGGAEFVGFDVWITMEHGLLQDNLRFIHIRRGYARGMRTPVEEEIKKRKIPYELSRGYVSGLTDEHSGAIKHSMSVFDYVYYINLWFENGVIKKLKL